MYFEKKCNTVGKLLRLANNPHITQASLSSNDSTAFAASNAYHVVTVTKAT